MVDDRLTAALAADRPEDFFSPRINADQQEEQKQRNPGTVHRFENKFFYEFGSVVPLPVLVAGEKTRFRFRLFQRHA